MGVASCTFLNISVFMDSMETYKKSLVEFFAGICANL